MHNIQIYIDGSSLIKNNDYESSTGVIFYDNDKEIARFGQYHKDGTNSKGEVYGMKIALEMIHKLYDSDDNLKNQKIIIISDSEYVVKSVKSWIYNWVKNGWKTAKGSDISFKSEFMEMYDKYLNRNIKNKNIKIWHINSHVKDITKARRKFQLVNSIDLDNTEFKKYVSRNDEVDKFANYIRLNKIESYDETNKLLKYFQGSDDTWEIRRNEERNLIVLHRRNIKQDQNSC